MSENLFDKCHCEQAGFCPIFEKIMTENPPNWQWCKTASCKERENYKYKTTKIHGIKYKLLDINKLQLACVGHSKIQFDTIKNQPYLKKIYLQDLDLGKYHQFQNNYYAENRIFLADNIFDQNKDFIGTVSASWNLKYKGQNKIDEIEKWMIYDLNNDIIIGGILISPKFWIEGEKSVFNFLGLKEKYQKLILKFHENIGLSIIDKEVHPHNQYICNKKIYYKFINHFREHIFEIDKLIKTIKIDTVNNFARKRFYAYVLEFSNLLWFANQNYKHISVQTLSDGWYNINNIVNRDEGKYIV